MTACQHPGAPGALERDRLYQHKVSLVVRYFMIPCNICLILLATSTLGFAVLLFLNNCQALVLRVLTCGGHWEGALGALGQGTPQGPDGDVPGKGEIGF
ncbi:hypothetical protein DV515_00016076 [Chloebia gouldiae]|uniref:Agrin n=1 Tax=Chloebia gouldiae TaxID=44316 RepID=A0A3L8RTZ6_CHLGU|nr:hypothetical protein DV515_00016076 [Chloebia gouldiae]